MLTSVLDALSMPVAIFDRDGVYRHVNRRLCEVTQMAPEALLGSPVGRVAPDFAEAVRSAIDTVLAHGEPLRARTLAGRVRERPERIRTWVADFSPLPGETGDGSDGSPRVLMVAHEVTEQIARERALSDNLAHVRQVLDSLFAFVGVLLPDGTLIEANRAPLQAAGISWADVHGKPFWDCWWWSYDPAAQALCRDSVERAAAGETVRFDVLVRMAGGVLVNIDYMIAPMRDEHGRITHLIPSGNDISARVQSEQELARSERRFRELFENVPSGLAVVDEAGRVLQVNAEMERLSGHRRDGMIGEAVEMLVPETHMCGHVRGMRQYWSHEGVHPKVERVLSIKRRDGSVIPVEVSLTRVPSEGSRQVMVALTDCSQREAAKADLERALREKTGLLNEVHHRVKNNLQVVSSLLSLQRRSAPVPAQDALNAAQGRVKSMALIHQLLYEGRDYAQIDLGVYIARLVRLLREGLVSAQSDIRLVVDVPPAPVYLDLQRAVPCGLLINELVTNALKHAFPEGRTGTVNIGLGVADTVAGEARLRVDDDGVGLSADLPLDGSCRSLGLQLVPLLAEQLGARMAVERTPGTRFAFDFAVQAAA